MIILLCGLLCSQQSGFRKNRSTITALVDVIDHIYNNMDNSQLTGIAFRDIKTPLTLLTRKCYYANLYG